MKLCQNVKSHKSKLSSKLGHVGLKLGHYVKSKTKTCEHARGHSFDPNFMKLCQNVNPYII